MYATVEEEFEYNDEFFYSIADEALLEPCVNSPLDLKPLESSALGYYECESSFFYESQPLCRSVWEQDPFYFYSIPDSLTTENAAMLFEDEAYRFHSFWSVKNTFAFNDPLKAFAKSICDFYEISEKEFFRLNDWLF